MVQLTESPAKSDQSPEERRDPLLVKATTELRNRLETFLPDGQEETIRTNEVRSSKYRIKRTPDGFEIEEADIHPSRLNSTTWEVFPDHVTATTQARSNTTVNIPGENSPQIPPYVIDLNVTATQGFLIMMANTQNNDSRDTSLLSSF